MNILFLLKTLATGGLEVVTSVLANKFVSEKHEVWIFSFLQGTNTIAHRLDKRVKLVTGKEYKASRENVMRLRGILTENHIDVIVNQWGASACSHLDCKKSGQVANVYKELK